MKSPLNLHDKLSRPGSLNLSVSPSLGSAATPSVTTPISQCPLEEHGHTRPTGTVLVLGCVSALQGIKLYPTAPWHPKLYPAILNDILLLHGTLNETMVLCGTLNSALLLHVCTEAIPALLSPHSSVAAPGMEEPISASVLDAQFVSLVHDISCTEEGL